MQPLQPGKHMLWLYCCWVQACQTRQRGGGGRGGPYSACDWVWRYWSDWGGICISPEGYVPAGAGWTLLTPLVAALPGQGPQSPWSSGAADFPCGCLLAGQTQRQTPYRPRRPSCGSVWLTCIDKLTTGLWSRRLLLNEEEPGSESVQLQVNGFFFFFFFHLNHNKKKRFPPHFSGI